MTAPSVQLLDDLCSKMYSSTTIPERQGAQAQLDQLTQHDGNLDGTIYTTILRESTNQYTLLFCAQSVVVWFKANEKRFSLCAASRLCSKMYSSTTIPERQGAQAQLDQLTQHDGNLDGTIYTTILRESTNQYTLLFCAQSVVVWFKANEKRFSLVTQGEIVLAIVDATKRLKQCNAPRHVLSAIITSAAKVSKIGCEKEPLLLAGAKKALQMIESEIPTASNAAANLSVAITTPQESAPSSLPDEVQLGGLEPAPPGFYLSLGLQLLNAFVMEFNLYDSSKHDCKYLKRCVAATSLLKFLP
ncbi:Hypothetical protein, putative [Bodo saltans]|uniref:Uncharacterized protein n=1 Tax=Bodo saltans TaxID=75058 RepID=A0A0S4IYL9_BODSA|nr:Hypothetical protein, putative [Bodo saltans]|eukprot:CUF76785.1 Hypothetical protein, putative [Bodo saltans]